MNKMAVSKNISEQMSRSDLDWLQLADRLNIPLCTMKKWLNGDRIPTAYAVYRMAKVFGCTMEDIMEGVEI